MNLNCEVAKASEEREGRRGGLVRVWESSGSLLPIPSG
jgi:hypothetical protein